MWAGDEANVGIQIQGQSVLPDRYLNVSAWCKFIFCLVRVFVRSSHGGASMIFSFIFDVVT